MTPRASPSDPVLSPAEMTAYYERGRFHEDDGYYGILPMNYHDIVTALQKNPQAHDFHTLTGLFPKCLKRLDPFNNQQIKSLLAYFPEASVIVFVRGQVDRVTSMFAYGQDSGAYLPRETIDGQTLPNGC